MLSPEQLKTLSVLFYQRDKTIGSNGTPLQIEREIDKVISNHVVDRINEMIDTARLLSDATGLEGKPVNTVMCANHCCSEPGHVKAVFNKNGVTVTEMLCMRHYLHHVLIGFIIDVNNTFPGLKPDILWLDAWTRRMVPLLKPCVIDQFRRAGVKL